MTHPNDKFTTSKLAERAAAAASRVQAMSPLRRALIAREGLIDSAGGEMTIGPAEARLRKILVRGGQPAFLVVSLALLAKRIYAGYRYARPACDNPKLVFVGIRALREKQLISALTEKTNLAPAVVDQRYPQGYSNLPAPPALRALHYWRQIMDETRIILSHKDPDFARLDLLSSIAIRAHELAWLISLFEMLRIKQPDICITTSTADLPAHAAKLAGCPVEYHQHGLLKSTLIFPSFTAMTAITAYEGCHVRSRVPDMTVRLAADAARTSVAEPLLALAGDYLATDPGPVTALVDLAQTHGLSVVVRPHPHGHDRLWSGIRGRDDVTFESEGSFEEFLEKWRPSFVASWFSTTLVDGLMAGAVPITLSLGKTDLVLPLHRIALQFPKEKSQLEACMNDVETREHAWKSFHSVVME